MWPHQPTAAQRRLLRHAAETGETFAKRDILADPDTAAAKRREWDLLRLEQAGLLAADGSGGYRLTPEGRAAAGFANAWPANEFAAAFQAMERRLEADLLGRLHAATPQFFEAVTVDLLLAMGYGKGRPDLAQRIGRSHDGGIDALIECDELGLDTIYVQAKRYAPANAVPLAAIRDFAGALDAHRAAKGVFITSARFPPAAVEFCRHLSRRVALIDGARLATLMIRHGLGVRLVETFQVKEIDPAYFAGTFRE